MFTPENDSEKMALKMISPDDDIHTVIKTGTFSDIREVFGVDVFECNEEYYRAEENEDSVMFVITPKSKGK